MKVKSVLTPAVMLAAIVLTGCAGAAFAQTQPPSSETTPPRTLTVSGSGKVFATPDIANITVGVHIEGRDAMKAVAENNTSTAEVIDTLKAMGVAAKDIQTTNYSIYPQREYDTEGKPTGVVLYIVDNSVYVTVRDLDQVGKILNEVVKSGANSINGIQFDVSDPTAVQSQARAAAVDNAHAKAQELAKAAGVTLGPVQTISEYTSSAPAPMYAMRDSVMAAPASVPVEAGQLALTIEVNIVYQIQ